jgi:hypothetical protein
VSNVIGLYFQLKWFNKTKGMQILCVFNVGGTTVGQPGLIGNNSQDWKDELYAEATTKTTTTSASVRGVGILKKLTDVTLSTKNLMHGIKRHQMSNR